MAQLHMLRIAVGLQGHRVEFVMQLLQTLAIDHRLRIRLTLDELVKLGRLPVVVAQLEFVGRLLEKRFGMRSSIATNVGLAEHQRLLLTLVRVLAVLLASELLTRLASLEALAEAPGGNANFQLDVARRNNRRRRPTEHVQHLIVQSANRLARRSASIIAIRDKAAVGRLQTLLRRSELHVARPEQTETLDFAEETVKTADPLVGLGEFGRNPSRKDRVVAKAARIRMAIVDCGDCK